MKESHSQLWWTVGAIAAVGIGCAAYFLFLNKDKSDTSVTTTAPAPGQGITLSTNAPEENYVPEYLPEVEDSISTQEITELKIVDVVDEEKEIKDQYEILEDTRVLGSENREGLEDINKKAATETVVEQAPEPKKPDVESPVSMAMVAEKPQFVGGDKAMMKWLNDNINYPDAAAEEGAQGKVQVQFVVEKDGSVSNVKVLRGKHPALDAEAIRVVRKMPKWLPGRNHGVPVRVIYVLPVAFRLTN